VFGRNQGGADNWGQVKKLTASDGTATDIFGRSISISGDTLVVGAVGDDDAGLNSGSAYVFGRNQGGADNWGQVKKLTASDAAAGDSFGSSVSVSGDTVVASAVADDTAAGADAGSAYVFARNQGGADNWGQVKKLTASDAAALDDFGRSVSISVDTVVVGSRLDDDAGSASGSAYVFARNQGGTDNWGQVKKLTASDASNGDWFGHAVSISGDTVVVGADMTGDVMHLASGSAYVFERNHGGANNWGQAQKLNAADAAADDEFGRSVSISGDVIVVGAQNDDTQLVTDHGSAYVFERNLGGANNWGEVEKLSAPDAAAGDQFGFSVSISGETVVTGAQLDDTPAGSNSGSAYVFDLACAGVPGEASPASDMRASRNGSSIDVAFTPACGATDHAAYTGVGPIAGGLEWRASTCGLGVDGTASFDPGVVPPGLLVYFVIVGYEGDDEGSYGTRSNGAERPEAIGVGSCDRALEPKSCE
jgi:hypothetical protein